MQVDHTLYLNSNHMSQEGIDTENRMGNTCCRQTMDPTLNSLATQNLQQRNSFLLEAIKKQWLLILIIDDYTNVHTHRRPKGIHTSTTAMQHAYNCCKGIKKSQSHKNDPPVPV